MATNPSFKKMVQRLLCAEMHKSPDLALKVQKFAYSAIHGKVELCVYASDVLLACTSEGKVDEILEAVSYKLLVF